MTDKFNPINVWNKHRYEDRIETVETEHDDDNNAPKVYGTTVTHHYEREQRSSSIDEATHAEVQREPVQNHPSNFGDYAQHPDHILVQDSGVKNRTEDMVSRIPPTLQDLSKSNKGEPPEYQAKSPLTHDEDIRFFGDSKVANNKSRSTLDQEGLHRGSVTTLPAAGQRRKSSQKSPDRISSNDSRSSQETGSKSNQYHNSKGSHLIDVAVATVATAGAVGASVATGVTNVLTGYLTKENNHDMPCSWLPSEESVNNDNDEIKDNQSKTSTYRSNKDTKSSGDQTTRDDKHGFCDRVEEPEIQGQTPNFYDNSSKSRRWSEGWHRNNSATPPENRTFSKGLLATGAAATDVTAAGAATYLGKQQSAKTGKTITKDSRQDTSSDSPKDDFIENELSEEALVDSDDSYTDSGIPSTWGDQVAPVPQYPNGSKAYETQANQGYKGDEGITSLPRNVNRMHRQQSRSSQGLKYSNSQDQNLVDQFSSGGKTNKLASAVAAGSLTGRDTTAAYQNRKDENRSKEKEGSQLWLSNQDSNSSNDLPSEELSHTQWTEVDQDTKPKTWTKNDQSLPIGTGQDEKHEAFVDQNLNRSGTNNQTTTTQQTTTIGQEQKAFGGSSAFGNTGTTAVSDNQHEQNQEDSQAHNSSSKGIVGAAAAAVGGLFGFASKEKHDHYDSNDDNRGNTRQSDSDHIHDVSYEQCNKDNVTPIGGGRYEVDQNDVKLNRDGRYESSHATNLEPLGGGRFEVDSTPIDRNNTSRHVKGTSPSNNSLDRAKRNTDVSFRSKHYEQANDDTITPIGGGRYEVDQNDVKLNRDGRYESSHATNLEPLGGGRYEVDSSPVAHNNRSHYESIQDESIQPTSNSRQSTRQSDNVPIGQRQYENIQKDTITPIGGGRYEVDQNDVKLNRDGRYESSHATSLEPLGGGRYEIDASPVAHNNRSHYESIQDESIQPTSNSRQSTRQSDNVPIGQRQYEHIQKDTITPIGGGRYEVDQNDVKLNRDGCYESSHATNLEPLGDSRYEIDASDVVRKNESNFKSVQENTVDPIRGNNHKTDTVSHKSDTVNRNNDTGKGVVAGAAGGASAVISGMSGLNQKNKHDNSTRSTLPVSNLDQDTNSVSTSNYSHSKLDTISNNQRDRSSPQRGINTAPHTSNVETRGNNVNPYTERSDSNKSSSQNSSKGGIKAAAAGAAATVGGILGLNHNKLPDNNDKSVNNTRNKVPSDDHVFGENVNHVYGQTTDNNTYGDTKGNAFYGANVQNNTTYGQNEIFEGTAVNKSHDKKVTYRDEPISTYNDDELTKTANVVDHDDPKRRNPFAPTDFSGNGPDEADFKNDSAETRNVQRIDHHPVQHTNERVEHHPLEQASESRKTNIPIQQNPQQRNIHSSNAQTDYDVVNQNTGHKSAKTAIASALGLDNNKHATDIKASQNVPISTTNRNKDVPNVPGTSNSNIAQPDYSVKKEAGHESAKTAIADALGLDHHNKHSDNVTTRQYEPITTTHRVREVPNMSRDHTSDIVNPPYGYDVYHEHDAIHHKKSDNGAIGSAVAASAVGDALDSKHEYKFQDGIGHRNPYHSVQGQGYHGEGIHDRNVIGGTAVGSDDHTDTNHTTIYEPIATTAVLDPTLGGDVATTRDTNSDEKGRLNTGRRDSIVPGLPSEIAEEDHSGNFASSQPIPYETSTNNRELPSNYDRRGSKGSINRRRSSIISAMMGNDHKNKKYSDKDTGYERSQKYQDAALYSGRTKSLPSVKQHDADVRGSLFNHRYAEEPDVVDYNSGQYVRGTFVDNNATGSNKLRHLPTHHEDDPSYIDRDVNQLQAPLVDEPVHPMDTSRHGNNYESYEIEGLKHDQVRRNSKSGNGIISSVGGILGLNHRDNNERDDTVNEHHSAMVASTVGVAGASAAPLGGVPALREGPFSENTNASDQPRYHKAMLASTVGVSGASTAPTGGILGLSREEENEGTHVEHDVNTGRNNFDNQRNTRDPSISNRSYSSGQNNQNSLNSREAGDVTNTRANTNTTGGQRVTATEAAVAAAPRGNTNVSDSQYNNAYANARNVSNKPSKGPMAVVGDKLGITHHNENGQNQTVNYQDYARSGPRQNVNYRGDNNLNGSNHLSENHNDTIHRGQQNPMINETTQPSYENRSHRKSSTHAKDVESVSSTRATTGKIIPDICNEEVARRRSSVYQPGDFNTIDHLNNPSHRKNSLTQDIKEKFTNAVRRLSHQGSGAPYNERRLSAAEVYKNEQQSTNHHPNTIGNNATHGTVPSYQEQTATRGTNAAPRNEPITSTARNVNTVPRKESINGTSHNAPIIGTTSGNLNTAPLNSNVLSQNGPVTGTRPAQQSNVLPQNNTAHPIVLPRDNVLNSKSGSNRTNVNSKGVSQTTTGTRQGNSHVPGVYTLRPAGEINIINNETSPNGPVKAIIVPAKEGA